MFFACLSMFTSGIIEIVRQQRCQGGKENSHCYFRIYIEIFKKISILIYRYILNWHRIYLWACLNYLPWWLPLNLRTLHLDVQRDRFS